MGAGNEQFAVSDIFNVEGIVAVVTGGATGIGLMCAQALFANGAKVYILQRSEEKMQKTLQAHGTSAKGEVISIQCDVTSKKDIEKAVAEIKSKEKYINLLVNNSGISGPTASMEADSVEKLSENLMKQDFSDWNSVFETNVSAIYFVSAAFLPLLAASSGKLRNLLPRIVNVTSISGITKVSQNHLAYNSSKRAANGLTEMMAHEFGQHGILVNAIAPTVFPSLMTGDDADESNKTSIPDEMGEKMNHVVKRTGNDIDMASVLLLFATHNFLTGQILAVDGGFLVNNP